jgi:hypothetical protein
MPTVDDLAVYGAVYDGQIDRVTVEVIGGGLDIEGVCGDDLEFSVFFDYLDLTGYVFSAFVVLHDLPLMKSKPLTVVVADVVNGLITVKLSTTETNAIGPVSRKPWFMRWTDSTGRDQTILAGMFQLNRY